MSVVSELRDLRNKTVTLFYENGVTVAEDATLYQCLAALSAYWANGGGVSPVVITGPTAYAADFWTGNPARITLSNGASDGSPVSYSGTLPSGVTLSGNIIAGIPPESCSITLTATAGNVSQLVTVNLFNRMDSPQNFDGVPLQSEYFAIRAPNDLSLYSGQSYSNSYAWTSADVLTFRLIGPTGEVITPEKIRAFDGSDFDTVTELNHLHAGYQVVIPSGNLVEGDGFAVQWLRGGSVVKTENFVFGNAICNPVFRRPSGEGYWFLNVNGNVTPYLLAYVYRAGKWELYPAAGLGPEDEGVPVLIPNVVNVSGVCWQRDGIEGDVIW